MGHTARKDLVAGGLAAIHNRSSVLAAVWGREEVIILVVDTSALHVELSDAARQRKRP